ncbi:MAG: hypothetical protein FJX53_08385 [Alphaproteobacteria bacterium]|nr:hypothetical protein [Alphaproteobacteria bacterium]
MAADSDIAILDSVTKLGPAYRDKVAIAASHGGVYAGYVAARDGARAVILHDAGIGKDRAGVASLDYLDRIGFPAATIDHRTGRIGDGASMAAGGVISYLNKAAAALGCAAGQTAMDCARAMARAAPFRGTAPKYDEGRSLLRHNPGEPEVWGCDSVSLVKDGDEGHVIVSASHGEVLAADPSWGKRPKVLAALFNDAGADLAKGGGSRLPDLDRLGIAGALVDCRTARIGDSRSAWETGVVSACNDRARALGGWAGQTTQAFVAAVIDGAKGR